MDEYPEDDQDNEEDDFFDQVGEANFLGAFMLSVMSADMVYRQHYCEIVAQRVYDEFGIDGMCELMIALDKTADWISDIIIDAPDLENIAFKKYGVYDSEISQKARQTKAIQELNTKLWRLRKKYAKIIVDEIMQDSAVKE